MNDDPGIPLCGKHLGIATWLDPGKGEGAGRRLVDQRSRNLSTLNSAILAWPHHLHEFKLLALSVAHLEL